MSNNNKCDDHREAIAAFVLGELDTETSAEVRQHLQYCQECLSFHDALEREEQATVSEFERVKLNLAPLEGRIIRQLQCQSDQPRSATAVALGYSMSIRSQKNFRNSE